MKTAADFFRQSNPNKNHQFQHRWAGPALPSRWAAVVRRPDQTAPAAAVLTAWCPTLVAEHAVE